MIICQFLSVISVLISLTFSIYLYNMLFKYQHLSIDGISVPASRAINGEKLINHRQILKNKEIECKWEEWLMILENISDAIAVVSADGKYMFRNKTSIEFFPDAKIEIGDGFIYSEYYDMEGNKITKENLPANKVLRGMTIKAERMKFVQGDNVRYLSISGTPMYNGDGSIQYAVISSLDITEIVQKENLIRKQQEQLLKIEIEKNDALKRTVEKMNKISRLKELNLLKDKLLIAVTHDIRNPIAAMVSLIELLDGEKENYSSDSIEIIEAVKEQVYDSYYLVENLLEWLKSQKEGLAYSPLEWDISIIVQEAIHIFRISAEGKNIRIAVDIEEGVTVFTDRKMFELVLRNLLSNALKFTRNGGIISILAYQSENETIVAIRDTGVGIEREKAKMLFSQEQHFSNTGTAGEKGTGLGLLICREFITRSGGKIWADSTPGTGSTFYLSLPSELKPGNQTTK